MNDLEVNKLANFLQSMSIKYTKIELKCVIKYLVKMKNGLK